MKTLTMFINTQTEHLTHSSTYEVVENQVIEGKVFNNLTFSGALFSLSAFKTVTFESCTFYGGRWENCTFLGCTFKNCTFQFFSAVHNQFNATIFENSTWLTSSLRQNEMNYSFLDYKTLFYVGQNNNLIQNCSRTDENTEIANNSAA
jgi:uncharacterized protein YjbI with pentapeptide repeats